jgi:hypothetical protein
MMAAHVILQEESISNRNAAKLARVLRTKTIVLSPLIV